MVWFAVYGAIAAIVSVAALVFSDWAREPGAPAPSHPRLLALVAGLAWPVVVVGLVQWGLIAAYASRVSRVARPSAPAEPIVRVRELHRVA